MKVWFLQHPPKSLGLKSLAFILKKPEKLTDMTEEGPNGEEFKGV
jgi:hypothetical protein